MAARSPVSSQARSAASAPRSTKASTTTSSSIDRFVPEDIEAIENKIEGARAAGPAYERQIWPRDEAKSFFATRGELLKVAADRRETEGQKDVSVYTIKDKETFVDFCVGPHVPSTGKLEGVQAASARRTRTGRATRRTRRCSASTGPRSSPTRI